jgi:hypothetical protein
MNAPAETKSVYCPGFRIWMMMIMMKFGMTTEQTVFRIPAILEKVMACLMKAMAMSGKAGIFLCVI